MKHHHTKKEREEMKKEEHPFDKNLKKKVVKKEGY